MGNATMEPPYCLSSLWSLGPIDELLGLESAGTKSQEPHSADSYGTGGLLCRHVLLLTGPFLEGSGCSI